MESWLQSIQIETEQCNPNRKTQTSRRERLLERIKKLENQKSKEQSNKTIHIFMRFVRTECLNKCLSVCGTDVLKLSFNTKLNRGNWKHVGSLEEHNTIAYNVLKYSPSYCSCSTTYYKDFKHLSDSSSLDTANEITGYLTYKMAVDLMAKNYRK